MKRTYWAIVIIAIASACCIGATVVALNEDGQDSGSKVHYTVTDFEIFEESPVEPQQKVQSNLHGGDAGSLTVSGHEDEFIWIYIESTYTWTDGDEVPANLALHLQYKHTGKDTRSSSTFYSIFGEKYSFTKGDTISEGLLFLIPVPYEGDSPMNTITYDKLKTNLNVWIEDES